MTILTKNNLLDFIEEEVLDDITGMDDTKLDKHELSALGEVNGYLKIRYDASKCYDESLITPNPPTHDGYSGISTVREKLIDILLYNLHTRVMPDNIPSLRVKRYDNAITWLEKVADGFIAPALPIKDAVNTTPLRFGNSQTPQEPYY